MTAGLNGVANVGRPLTMRANAAATELTTVGYIMRRSTQMARN